MPMYGFDSRMNLSSLKWETKKEKRKRCKRERFLGREFIMGRCELVREDYKVGDHMEETIREANYVQRIFDREYQQWAQTLAGRGVLVTDNIRDLMKQIDGHFMKSSNRKRYYRTNISASYRQMAARYQLPGQTNAEKHRHWVELLEKARKARWDDLWKTQSGRKICSHLGVPLLSVYGRYRVGDTFDFVREYQPRVGHRPPASLRYLLDWHRMERRPTPYQEDWDDIMKKLRSSVLSSRREMNFDPSYIRPKWYCTRQGVLASYKKKGHWEPQHRMRNPPKDIKKAKSNRDDMIEAAGVESYKLIYGRDRSDNKSPPPAVRDDTSVVYSDSAGGFSDTGDKYTSDDDTNVDNVVLKLLTAANVESCKTLLESLVESPPSQNTTTASVLSDETRYFSSSEGNATSELTATSARSNGDASSDTYQLLLDTFQANIRQQVANMGHTQSRLNFTEDDENTSGTPSEGTAMKPNIPRQGEKKLNAPSEESEKSFKGSIQSPDQDRQVEDLNMSAVSSMLLNAFCRATHDALRELHSNPDVSPKASEELLEAALTIATDEELFATLFTSVSRLPWSSTTPDSSLTGDTTGSRRTQTHEHLQRQVNPELAYGTSTSADESSEILDGSFLAEDKKEQKRAFASDSQTHAQNRRSSMQQTRKTKTCTNNSARTSRSDGSTTGTHESDDSSTGTPSDGDVIRSGRKVNHAARARRRQILYNSLECPVQIHNPRGRPSGSGPRLNLTVHRQESEDSASDTSSYSDVLNSDGLGDTDGAERKPDHSHSTLRSDGRRNGVGEFYEHTAARKQLLTLQCRSNRDKRCLPVKQHDVFSEM